MDGLHLHFLSKRSFLFIHYKTTRVFTRVKNVFALHYLTERRRKHQTKKEQTQWMPFRFDNVASAPSLHIWERERKSKPYKTPIFWFSLSLSLSLSLVFALDACRRLENGHLDGRSDLSLRIGEDAPDEEEACSLLLQQWRTADGEEAQPPRTRDPLHPQNHRATSVHVSDGRCRKWG